MPGQVLEQLFDSPVKVRLLKLFLRNPNEIYSITEIADLVQFKQRQVKKEVEGLLKIDFLKKKRIKKKNNPNKKPGMYFSVNQQFDFYNELRTLVLKSSPASLQKIFEKIKRLGRVKLAIVSGIFVNADGSRVDVFVVGDGIDTRKVANFLKGLEADVGKHINYSVLTTEDFKYRFSMFDRFILDILEKPHKKLINKLRI